MSAGPPPLSPLARLAVLAALAAVATPAALTTHPTLVVLRAACEPPRPDLFDEGRLRRYAARVGRSALGRHTFTVLGYNETCGSGWRERVARRALGALGGGGVLAAAGWLGAPACAALAEGARVLRGAAPLACGEETARGAVLAALAARLRWRTARLAAPPGPGSWSDHDCAATLRSTQRALDSAGLLIDYESIDHPLKPHVVIECAWSGRAAEREEPGQRRQRQAARGVLLLLDVAPAPEPPHTFYQNSNITIDIRNSPYLEIKDNSSSPAKITMMLNSSFGYQKMNSQMLMAVNSIHKSVSTGEAEHKEEASEPVVGTNASTQEDIHTVGYQAILLNKTSSALRHNDPIAERGTLQRISKYGHDRQTGRLRRQTLNEESNDLGFSIDSKNDFPKQFLQLLLTTLPMENGRKRLVRTENDIYDEVLRSLSREEVARRSRVETATATFFLYERMEISAPWRRVVQAEAHSTRSLDAYGEWSTQVSWGSGLEFEAWCSRVAAAEGSVGRIGSAGSTAGGAALGGALAGGSALLAALLAALWARRARGRRRRGGAVLVGADFTFPPDERRRVGEGMETMLSCWLQQLHEFGGPEPDQPDLLKRPPHVLPGPPSAPSSTCSVNRIIPDRRTRYKGDPVHLKYLPMTGALELRSKCTDMLFLMQNIRHENLNPFIGCLCEPRAALVWDACGRGSLEDVLVEDEIKLDWTFRLSLLTDLVRGMRHLHSSQLRVHGRLTSRNCVIDSRWVLRITDFGLSGFYRTQGLVQPPLSARDLLWTAPELLRDPTSASRGSQPGDVFSFGIIMQEVIVRGEPYCMLSLTPEEIVEKLSRPPPLIRPSVSIGAAPPEAVSVMRQCWSEPPDLRPDFNRLHDIFRHLHRGRKVNIVDSMFEMLEKYSNNLEELIRERTDQLDMEKKKTEQLLNRMLPRSVAERLLLGSRVEPEEFEEVSIYFSDIVGFTALAARSTPVQVVDLLNDLYTTFDGAIEQYRVYKVETIGDAYMVVGGLPVRARDHAESVATMALHLLHLAGRFRIRHLPGTPLHLRIGLHTGPCCAGVVGLTMPRYCLFGDTVNTASRMESTGAAWRIQTSSATAERLVLAGGYRLRSRGLTHIKGKGVMHTYWLLGKDGFDKSLPTPPSLESEEVLFETEGENDSEVTSNETESASRSEAQTVERQCSEPSPGRDRYAWQRSGAMSADSSPPALHARYRRGAGATRSLRRQWSLELAGAGEAPAPAARYRTRPEPPAPAVQTSAALPTPRC